MNIFGIGTAELIIIILLLLLVAGPKRAIQWAYTAGQYWSRVKHMAQDAMRQFQKELEQAGIDPETVETAKKIARTRSLRGVGVVDELTNVFTQSTKELTTISFETKKPAAPKDGTAPTLLPKSPSLPPVENLPSSTPDEDTPGRYDAWTSSN